MTASALTFRRRLPGVDCSPALPATDRPLRLDVAAFVGFAQQGPLDLPIAVSDVNQFVAVFGGDLVLATDAGRPVHGRLLPSVRAFFDNGGARCHVVRVAGPNARPARFAVPGLQVWQPDGSVADAVVEAAWPGAWSAGTRLDTRLLVEPLAPAGTYRRATAAEAGRLRFGTGFAVAMQPGDLVRLDLGPARPLVYARVRDVTAEAGTMTVDGELPYVAGSGPAATDRPAPGALDGLPAEVPIASAALLRMDLVARQHRTDGARLLDRQADLAFNAPASPAPGPATATRRPTWLEALQPAGDPVPDPARSMVLRGDLGTTLAATNGLVVPVGMEQAGAVPAESDAATVLAGDTAGHDDLGTFPIRSFVDAALASASLYHLVEDAAQITVLSRSPRRLAGVHALLAVDEVAMVAVPDATHLGWSPSADAPVLDDVADYDETGLLDVQTALVTMCAARGDAVALLSVPAHYDTDQVLRWRERLAGRAELADAGPSGTSPLSYAAYWHPWVRVFQTAADTSAPLRDVPPDGMVAGMIAARERDRGVWVAPANLPLRGPVQTTAALTGAETARLFDAHANLVRRQPGAITVLSARTLSADPALVQLSVRRLLILIRRIALAEGALYTFQTDNEQFRRLVRMRFERILASLAAAGAFHAYRVVTAGSGDGAVVVDLAVAPSSPIEFITISLVRSGEGLLDVREH